MSVPEARFAESGAETPPNRDRAADAGFLLAILALAFFLSLCMSFNSPLWIDREPPDPDSGVFLYAGTRVLHGDVPYRDFWDHKPPAIFYIDALGLWMGSGARWGVWIVEALAICTSALLGYWVLKRAFGRWPALAGSVAWLLNGVYVFRYGNVPDLYALPVHFAMLLLIVSSYSTGLRSWRGVIGGGLFVLAWVTKSNFVGLWLAFPVYQLFVGKYKVPGWWREDLALLSGAGIALAVVIAYFALHGALYDFWDVTIRFNLLYSANHSLEFEFERRLRAFSTGFSLNQYTGSAALAFHAWFMGVGYVRRHLKTPGSDSADRLRVHLLAWVLCAFPIDVLSSLVTGLTLPQYYCSWQPTLSVLVAFWVYSLVVLITRSGDFRVWGKPAYVVLALIAVMGIVPLSGLALRYKSPQIVPQMRYTDTLADYIEQQTAPDDYVVIWGREAAALYLSDRVSPTRFFYTVAMAQYAPTYLTTKIVDEYVNDIIENRPSLVIFSPEITTLAFFTYPDMNPKDDLPPEWQRLFTFLSTHYDLTTPFGPGWAVYHLRDS